MVHLGDEALEVAAEPFDRVVDEHLLAGELFQVGVEVALGKFGDTGHGLLFHGNVAGDHAVDALGHGPVSALELIGGDHDVDVALVVLVRHAVHFGDEALEVCPQPFDRVVDEHLLAGELFQVGVEVALAELGDAGHGLLLHGDVAGNHLIDALGHVVVGTRELVGGNGHVDVTLVVFVRHVLHLADQAAQGLDALVEVVLDLVEVAVVSVGDLCRDVTLGNPVHVLGSHVDRGREGVGYQVHGLHYRPELRSNSLWIGASLEFALLDRIRKPFALGNQRCKCLTVRKHQSFSLVQLW